MDLIEDEPRKFPKPVPFVQNALLQPTVPEVSLLVQDNFSVEKKNDSFSGTEFQTYNAWRWKYLKTKNDTELVSDNKKFNKFSNTSDYSSFKEKSFSDIEKRKNEILYGDPDEPRRPLPPRASPVIPKCTDLFTSPSFDDLKLLDDVKDRYTKPAHPVEIESKNYPKLEKVEKSGLDNSDKLYNIISEQNKQIDVLQKQIEQLLKMQEVKDKQIAQLLKCQESKEKKIEQLLESLDTKDKEIDQLIKLKEKQDQHVKELLKSEEEIRKENMSLIRKLNEIKHKDVHTVGVNTQTHTLDANTSANIDYCPKECCNKKDDLPDEEISCIRDLNESNRFDGKDKSISLHSGDLPVIQEHLPTPQSSIHVDMQDFLETSDECDNDSGTPSNNFLTSSGPHSNPLGYTFYNNVLTQVKDIIQNCGKTDAKENMKSEGAEKVLSKPQTGCNYVLENRGRVQSFQAWDISERENILPHNNGERLLYKSPSFGLKDSHSPSDISLKINALAMKYLKQEQISQYDIPTQVPTSCQHDVTIYNVTNLSFGSMRYLDRYKMLPKLTESQQGQVHNDCSPAQFLQRRKKTSVQENVASSMGNVLDISTLNQQPKLL